LKYQTNYKSNVMWKNSRWYHTCTKKTLISRIGGALIQLLTLWITGLFQLHHYYYFSFKFYSLINEITGLLQLHHYYYFSFKYYSLINDKLHKFHDTTLPASSEMSYRSTSASMTLACKASPKWIYAGVSLYRLCAILRCFSRAFRHLAFLKDMKRRMQNPPPHKTWPANYCQHNIDTVLSSNSNISSFTMQVSLLLRIDLPPLIN
jgi:hypothetical protein